MKNVDSELHVRGASLFADDLPEPCDLAFAKIFSSTVPHAKIKKLDLSQATQSEGVVRIFSARDIPGMNQIGSILQDEPLLADEKVDFVGQPIALVVAQTEAQAAEALTAINADFEPLKATFDARKAAQEGLLISPKRTLSFGDVESAFKSCDVVVEGTTSTGAQEHAYLETQSTLAFPTERGGVKLYTSTQSPTEVQRLVAKTLSLSMNAVEVEVARLGGGFGGKEHQAIPYAALAALAASKLERPCKLVLSRGEDMRMTGKRHPYDSEYKLGLSKDGRILAFEATLYQNAGAAADLSPAILERSLFHITNSYSIPNVRVISWSCRTNLPPFTAFRGFGAPQAVFVIEAAIDHSARTMKVDAKELRKANLLKDGDIFPYGMKVEDCRVRRCFKDAEDRFDINGLQKSKDRYNTDNHSTKRGISVLPICFGISFTKTFLNQAGALVHVYLDGSISIHTGAVEMGQGVNTKIAAIATHTLGVSPRRISIGETNTSRVANTSPTAASSGADLNGKATELACQSILERLLGVAAKKLKKSAGELKIQNDHVYCSCSRTDLSFRKLILLAYASRVCLSAQAYYATPGIWYNNDREAGSPFSYHVFGTAVTEVTLDCSLGTYTVDRIRIVHDAGKSLNELIDEGQIEGGVVQGLGWVGVEEVRYEDGHLITNSLNAYKIPDIVHVPKIEIVFLENAANKKAVLSSKAIGEPPFIYGMGAYFALIDAMNASRSDQRMRYELPMTAEKVLAFLLNEV